MSQVIIPDGVKIGASGIYIFAPPNGGDPNAFARGLLVQRSVTGHDSVALGSTFVDVVTGAHWVKTGAIDADHPSGTWTQMAIP